MQPRGLQFEQNLSGKKIPVTRVKLCLFRPLFFEGLIQGIFPKKLNKDKVVGYCW